MSKAYGRMYVSYVSQYFNKKHIFQSVISRFFSCFHLLRIYRLSSQHFAANVGPADTRHQLLSPRVRARHLRIIPYRGKNDMCFIVEVYGCSKGRFSNQLSIITLYWSVVLITNLQSTVLISFFYYFLNPKLYRAVD